jgi:6-phosphogluconate dehydrogenase (decarboxylating)
MEDEYGVMEAGIIGLGRRGMNRVRRLLRGGHKVVRTRWPQMETIVIGTPECQIEVLSDLLADR